MLKLFCFIVILQVSWCSLDSVNARKLAIIREINALKKDSGPPVPSSIFVTSRNSFDLKKPADQARSSSWRRELVVEPDATTETSVSVIHSPGECIDCETPSDPSATFKPFSQEELNQYLKKYQESQGKPKGVETPSNKLASLYINEPINVLEPSGSQDKSKGWHLMQSQTHNHPYDDRQGWVTLEPVPWSQSQVQKWEPNPHHKPPQLPQWEEPSHSHYRPRPPPHSKPTYDYGQRPTQRPSHWDNEPQHSYTKPSWQQIWSSNSDIITDNRPSSFPDSQSKPPWESQYSPSYNHHSRPHTEIVYHGQKESHGSAHPSDGDGQWVLLSSTKGYSYPNRKGYQRSLSKEPAKSGGTISSHRTVRLTVLPALNGTTNTTTSHGGLLEVEQTSQTVDESQREHAARMLRLERLEQQRRGRQPHPVAARRSSPSIAVLQSPDNSRANAAMAAVGAGMIPATVAMLLPFTLGRKRRDLRYESIRPSIPKPNFTH